MRMSEEVTNGEDARMWTLLVNLSPVLRVYAKIATSPFYAEPPLPPRQLIRLISLVSRKDTSSSSAGICPNYGRTIVEEDGVFRSLVVTGWNTSV